MFIEVIKPGPLSSIQDGGRLGYLHTGLAPAGPMDHLSLRIASLLVGNEIPPPLFCGGSRGDAGFEFTLIGPTIKFHADTIIALAGAEMPALLDGTEVPYYESIPINAGNMLTLGAARRGARTYLAVAGGLAGDPVLGSRSENLFSSRGPFGRALKKGDSVITIGGIHGRIIDVKNNTFIIEVHPGTKLKVLKTAVSMSGDTGIEQK